MGHGSSQMTEWSARASERTPGGHEDGDGDGGVVVEDVSKSSEVTAVAEVSVVAQSITFWTHDELRSSRVANLLPIDRQQT